MFVRTPLFFRREQKVLDAFRVQFVKAVSLKDKILSKTVKITVNGFATVISYS